MSRSMVMDFRPSAAAHTGRGEEAASPGQVLEEAIRRLEKANVSPHIRQAADGLLALGYVLIPADTRIPGRRPENYLQIRPRVLRSRHRLPNARNFSFSRGSDAAACGTW